MSVYLWYRDPISLIRALSTFISGTFEQVVRRCSIASQTATRTVRIDGVGIMYCYHRICEYLLPSLHDSAKHCEERAHVT